MVDSFVCLLFFFPGTTLWILSPQIKPFQSRFFCSILHCQCIYIASSIFVNIVLKSNLFILFIVWGGGCCMCAVVHMWQSEDKLEKFIFRLERVAFSLCTKHTTHQHSFLTSHFLSTVQFISSFTVENLILLAYSVNQFEAMRKIALCRFRHRFLGIYICFLFTQLFFPWNLELHTRNKIWFEASNTVGFL